MKRSSTGVVAAVVVLVALVLAGVVSRFADHDPDGLTKVSQEHGFAHKATTHHGLLGGYDGVTGVIGVVVVLGLAGGLGYAVRRRRSQDEG